MILYFKFQEWQEFLDRAFSVLIPQVPDESLDAGTKINKYERIILFIRLIAHFKTFIFSINHKFSDENERRILDVGCGPSISNIISASKWSQNIIMADFLESNRREVERFWKVWYSLVLPHFKEHVE